MGTCDGGLQVPEDMREMVLDAETDDFFRKHASLTFGEVGISVKALMEQYQSREAQHRQVRDALFWLMTAKVACREQYCDRQVVLVQMPWLLHVR